MADLSDLQSAQTVKIVGADSSGIETNAVNADANGNLHVSDILDAGGVNGTITVGTSAVAARVGGSNLTNRKQLTIHPKDTGVYYGMDSGVTTSNGIELFKDQVIFLPVGPNTTIYLIATGAGKNVRIAEMA